MKAELLDTKLPLSKLGEGPHWDADNHDLYWVDITGKKVYRYNTVRNDHEILSVQSTVGFAVLDQKGELVIGLGNSIERYNFVNRQSQNLATPAMHSDNRFNDAKCDGKGRLWAGTMHKSQANDLASGSLYRLDESGLKEFENDVYIANGIGWCPDYKTMYFTDTVRREIWQYDYDLNTGEQKNKRMLYKFDGRGRPDGLAIDSEGLIYSAQWPGWGIEILTPDGNFHGRIELPVPQVSSCAFGGPDLKTLFITTAYEDMSQQQIREAPLSGAVFAVEMNVPGMSVAQYAG